MRVTFHDGIVLLTGASSGIGEAMARLLAPQVRTLIIVARRQDRLENLKSSLLDSHPSLTVDIRVTDLSDLRATRDMASSVLLEHGAIDILINNAGIAHIGNVESTSAEDLDKIYNVNVKGVYNGMNAVVPIMVAQGGGAIVNLASVASKIGITDRFAYSMSKGAVLTITLSVARDYIEKNIRCNCVCPGRVHTPFVDQYLDKHYPDNREEMFEKLSKWQPIGRMGKPSEIASLVSYLVSDEASFITGSAYDVDGGTTLLR